MLDTALVVGCNPTALVRVVEILPNIAPDTREEVRHHAQLEKHPENAHEMVNLLRIHARVEQHFQEFFDVLEIDIVLEQLKVPQEDVVRVQNTVGHDGYDVGQEVTLEVEQHELLRILVVAIRRLAHLEEVEEDVQDLNEADVEVLLRVVDVVRLHTAHELVVSHDEPGQVKVKEERDGDNEVEVLELLVLGIDKELVVELKEAILALHEDGVLLLTNLVLQLNLILFSNAPSHLLLLLVLAISHRFKNVGRDVLVALDVLHHEFVRDLPEFFAAAWLLMLALR